MGSGRLIITSKFFEKIVFNRRQRRTKADKSSVDMADDLVSSLRDRLNVKIPVGYEVNHLSCR